MNELSWRTIIWGFLVGMGLALGIGGVRWVFGTLAEWARTGAVGL